MMGKYDKDMVVLAIEASGDSASVAVMRGGSILASAQREGRYGHAAHLPGLVAECIESAGIAMGDVQIVLGGRGPGSFTGVRVALAAVKGLVLGLGIAGYGIGSLAALGHAHYDGKRKVIVFGETRQRGLLYREEFPAGPPRLVAREIAMRQAAAETEAKIIGNMEAGDAEIAFTHAAPDAAHLCRFFHAIAGGGIPALPLDPFYLQDPLLGPAGKTPKEAIGAA